MGAAKKRKQERALRKAEQEKSINQKHYNNRVENLPVLNPKNEKQRDYIRLLYDNQMVIASGPAGTGKTMIIAHKAAEWLRKGEVDKVVVARPYVQMGKTAGFRPGTTEEKLYPYVRNILDRMKMVLRSNYQYYIDKGIIEIQALEDIRGRSFDDPSVLIIDEAQNATIEEIKSITTRVGEDCKLVLCGDPEQKDIDEESGLEYIRKIIEEDDISGCGMVDFEVDDIVRSGLVKNLIISFRKRAK